MPLDLSSEMRVAVVRGLLRDALNDLSHTLTHRPLDIVSARGKIRRSLMLLDRPPGTCAGCQYERLRPAEICGKCPGGAK